MTSEKKLPPSLGIQIPDDSPSQPSPNSPRTPVNQMSSYSGDRSSNAIPLEPIMVHGEDSSDEEELEQEMQRTPEEHWQKAQAIYDRIALTAVASFNPTDSQRYETTITLMLEVLGAATLHHPWVSQAYFQEKKEKLGNEWDKGAFEEAVHASASILVNHYCNARIVDQATPELQDQLKQLAQPFANYCINNPRLLMQAMPRSVHQKTSAHGTFVEKMHELFIKPADALLPASLPIRMDKAFMHFGPEWQNLIRQGCNEKKLNNDGTINVPSGSKRTPFVEAIQCVVKGKNNIEISQNWNNIFPYKYQVLAREIVEAFLKKLSEKKETFFECKSYGNEQTFMHNQTSYNAPVHVRLQRRHILRHTRDIANQQNDHAMRLSYSYPSSPKGHKVLSDISITNKGTVSEQLPEEGSYDAIVESIAKAMNTLSMDDKVFAAQVRDIAQGRLREANKKKILPKERAGLYSLHNIAHLLFQSEAYRRPSTLLTVAMMLELIENGNLQWKSIKDIFPMTPVGAISACRQWYYHWKEWVRKHQGDDSYWLGYHFDDIDDRSFADPFSILLHPTNADQRLIRDICKKERELYGKWKTTLHEKEDPWQALVDLVKRTYFSISPEQTPPSPMTPPSIKREEGSISPSPYPTTSLFDVTQKQMDASLRLPSDFCSPHYNLSAEELQILGDDLIQVAGAKWIEFLPSVVAQHTEDYASISKIIQETEIKASAVRVMAVNVSLNPQKKLVGKNQGSDDGEGEHWVLYLEHRKGSIVQGVIYNSADDAYAPSCEGFLEQLHAAYSKREMTFTVHKTQHLSLQNGDANCGICILAWIKALITCSEETTLEAMLSVINQKNEALQEMPEPMQSYREAFCKKLEELKNAKPSSVPLSSPGMTASLIEPTVLKF